MKKVIAPSIGFIALMLLWQFGCTSLLNLWPNHQKKVYYHYEYIFDTDSIAVGSKYVTTAIDTIPSTEESGAIIRVHLASR